MDLADSLPVHRSIPTDEAKYSHAWELFGGGI
jgi:hypothetical protein